VILFIAITSREEGLVKRFAVWKCETLGETAGTETIAKAGSTARFLIRIGVRERVNVR
jgi:hypothetical protein